MSRFLKMDFETALKAFCKAQADHDVSAQRCAVTSLEHYIAHGDTDFFRRFREAMSTNAKKDQLVKWAVHVSGNCIVFADGNFKQQEGVTPERIKAIDLEAATAIDMLTFRQKAEIKDFTGEDVVAKLSAVVKRMSNSEKFKATGNGGEMLNRAREAIESLKQPTTAAA